MLAPVEHVRRRATCGSVAGLLPAVADGDARLEGAAAAHVASCLRCQADLARYRRLRRTLRSLGEPVGPGPEVLPAILAALDQAGLPRTAHVPVRLVVTSAAITATVAGVGALALARRWRPFGR